jgi:hypothetical protein
MLKHMNDPVPDVRKLAPAVSEATRLLIMRMMAKKPAGRIQKASQVEALAKSIEQALLQGRVPQIPTSLAPPKPKPKPKPKPAPAPAPAPASQSPSGSGKVSKKGGRSGSSSMGRTSLSGEGPGKRKRQKEIGQRLKRMKKKRRF